MRATSSPTQALISHGARLAGKLQFTSSACFAAELEGSLSAAQNLVIEKQGRIDGKISCDTCRIEGVACGSLESKHEAAFVSGSSFTGKLQAGALQVEADAKFEAEVLIEPPPEVENAGWNKSIKSFFKKWLHIS